MLKFIVKEKENKIQITNNKQTRKTEQYKNITTKQQSGQNKIP